MCKSVTCPEVKRFCGRVAQLVEQVTFNHWVTGSNPVALTILLFVESYILQQIGGWPYGFKWTV